MRVFLLIIFLFIIISPTFCQVYEKPIALRILDIEKEAGYKIPDSIIVFIEKILKTAKETIKTKQQYTKQEALKILQQISNIHREYGISTKLHLFGDLLVTGLNEKKFDCGNYVIIYLSFAELLKLPINAVEAPGHIFINFKCVDNKDLYWETLYSCEKKKDYYIKHHHINNLNIKNGYYLRDLTEDDVISSRLVTISTVLREGKNYNDALKFDKRAIEFNPNNVSAFLGLGITYMKMKDYEKAKEYYFKSIEFNKDWSKIYSNFGVLYQSQNMFDSALYYFEKAIILDSNDYIVFHNRSTINLKLGEFELALSYINKALKIESGLDGIWSESLKLKGDILYRLKNFNEAISFYTHAIQLDSNFKFAYCNRALSYIEQKEYDSALSDFTIAIQIDSEFIDAFANRGRLYYYFYDDYNKAIDDLLFALSLDSSINDLYYLIGLSYYYLENYNESVSCLSKYINKNPDDIKAYSDRADSYLELYECDSSLKDYKFVIEKKKNEITTNDFENLLNCLLLCNKLDEIDEQLKNARQKNTNLDNWIIYIFYKYILKNSFEDAKIIFEDKIKNNTNINLSEILNKLIIFQNIYPNNIYLKYFIKELSINPDK